MPRETQAKAKARLSARALATLKATPGVEVIWDESLQGFGLRTRGRPDMADWRWVFRYRHQSGRQVVLTRGCPLKVTPEEARKWASRQAKLANTSDDPWEAKRRAQAELAAERAKPSVEELWRQWRRAEGALKKSAKGDAALWSNHIKRRLGGRKVDTLTQHDFSELRDEMHGQPVVANRVLALLSRMFTKAVEWGYRAGCAPEHPVKGVKRNPENRVEFFFTDEELARLLTAADGDASLSKGLVIRMLAITGARLGEVVTARWDQLTDFEDGTGRALWIVEAANTKANRTIARVLPKELAERLRNWRPLSLGLQVKGTLEGANSPKWIFPSETNPVKHMGRNIWKAWERMKDRACVKRGRIHDLRHTVATVLTEETGGLEAAFHQLGHATMLTTRRYAHLTAKARAQTSDIVAERILKAEAKARAKEEARGADLGLDESAGSNRHN